MKDRDKKKAPAKADEPEVYSLSPEEIESLRREMKTSIAWAKQQLAIDPDLKHL